MTDIRHITRWVSRYGFFIGPSGQEVQVRLVRAGLANDLYFVMTPWACLDAHHGEQTTDEQLAAALGRSYATHDEALEAANQAAPHWFAKHNQTVRTRLQDARRWRDEIVGDGQLADAMDVSLDELRNLANGKTKATKRQADAALAYHGGKV